jgi:hypothetical protein
MTEHERQLDLLAIFHFIVGGLTAFFACFPLIYVALGVAMILGELDGTNPPPPAIGWFFVLFFGMMVLCGWALATAIVIAGRRLRRRRAYMYCLVIAGLECIFMPFGTVLGVFTIIVLMKDSVKELFATKDRLGAGQSPT